jgi:putative PIG3 family NAD(P)H quinone oxidoreductase
MHAVTIPSFGGPEVLNWAEVRDPSCGPNDVVIDVAASAVNRADILQRQGHYPPPQDAPQWPGLECSGTISAVGSEVTSWQVGDQVCALLAGGGYAERVVVPAGQVLPVPRGLNLVAAAALPEAICTVWSNVVTDADLRAGEVLLAHGGASGIGTMAIQVGAALGATVAVTAGSEEKLHRCAELGASILINYRDDDFVNALREATDGHGADVVLDIIGAKYLGQNVDALASDGRLAVIGLQGGRCGELDLSVMMRKRARISGSTLRPRSVADKAAIVQLVRDKAWPLVESGQIQPIIDRAVSMREAADAHRIVEQSKHVGKVLLVTDHDISR